MTTDSDDDEYDSEIQNELNYLGWLFSQKIV